MAHLALSSLLALPPHRRAFLWDDTCKLPYRIMWLSCYSFELCLLGAY